jgi:hypothetical protein
MRDEARLLAQIGMAACGASWKHELARYLNISDRTMRHWIRGDAPIPSGVWFELRLLTECRRNIFGALHVAVVNVLNSKP